MLQLLQEGLIVGVEDEHVLVSHFGEGVLRLDDRADKAIMKAFMLHYRDYFRLVHKPIMVFSFRPGLHSEVQGVLSVGLACLIPRKRVVSDD